MNTDEPSLKSWRIIYKHPPLVTTIMKNHHLSTIPINDHQPSLCMIDVAAGHEVVFPKHHPYIRNLQGYFREICWYIGVIISINARGTIPSEWSVGKPSKQLMSTTRGVPTGVQTAEELGSRFEQFATWCATEMELKPIHQAKTRFHKISYLKGEVQIYHLPQSVWLSACLDMPISRVANVKLWFD